MAERRMIAKSIIDSDAFLDMPPEARLLYYDLSLRADDDGFVDSPKKILRMVGVGEESMRALAAAGFVIPFASGVVVITHWRVNNYIRKDLYRETRYLDERDMLEQDETGAYYLRDEAGTGSYR